MQTSITGTDDHWLQHFILLQYYNVILTESTIISNCYSYKANITKLPFRKFKIYVDSLRKKLENFIPYQVFRFIYSCILHIEMSFCLKYLVESTFVPVYAMYTTYSCIFHAERSFCLKHFMKTTNEEKGLLQK